MVGAGISQRDLHLNKLISLKACPLFLTFQCFSPPSRQQFELEHGRLLNVKLLLKYVEHVLVSRCVGYFTWRSLLGTNLNIFHEIL